MNHAKQTGFSLIELMMVIVIVGILAAIAYPSYQDSLTKGRRSDGQAKMMDLMNAEERYYTENGTYEDDLSTLAAVDDDGKVDSDEGFYKIGVAACGGLTKATCVILTAVPQGAQADDGNLTYNSQGVKTPADKW
jgi:type IV pilus assembly protein PilE